MDLSESPAVEPMETGGDERLGLRVAAVLLVVGGWGVMVLGNLLLHRLAPAEGWQWGAWTITSTLGPYAWGILGLGLGAGAVGIGLWWLSSSSRKAPVVLPGEPF